MAGHNTFLMSWLIPGPLAVGSAFDLDAPCQPIVMPSVPRAGTCRRRCGPVWTDGVGGRLSVLPGSSPSAGREQPGRPLPGAMSWLKSWRIGASPFTIVGGMTVCLLFAVFGQSSVGTGSPAYAGAAGPFQLSGAAADRSCGHRENALGTLGWGGCRWQGFSPSLSSWRNILAFSRCWMTVL